jgi:hypothetical protein
LAAATRRAVFQHVGQLGAFAFARGDELDEQGGEQFLRRCLQLICAQRVVRQHAGPAQHFGHRQRRGLGQRLAYCRVEAAQFRQQRRIGQALAGGVALSRLCLQVAAAFDLAARDALGDLFAQRHLQEAQVLAQAKADIEVARIDALDFKVDYRGAQVAAGGGIAGHAVDHCGGSFR